MQQSLLAPIQRWMVVEGGIRATLVPLWRHAYAMPTPRMHQSYTTLTSISPFFLDLSHFCATLTSRLRHACAMPVPRLRHARATVVSHLHITGLLFYTSVQIYEPQLRHFFATLTPCLRHTCITLAPCLRHACATPAPCSCHARAERASRLHHACT